MVVHRCCGKEDRLKLGTIRNMDSSLSEESGEQKIPEIMGAIRTEELQKHKWPIKKKGSHKDWLKCLICKNADPK